MKNKVKRTKYVIFKNKSKVALVLGGGGARGFAHIGVIKAFEEHGIEFDMVVGTSAGALVGGMYSAGLSSEQILEETKDFKLKDIRTSTIPFMPNKPDAMIEVYNKIIGGPKNFNDLKIPFCAVAVDVRSGNEIHLTKGDVARAVVASCAVPGIFFPVEIDDYKLFDGGLLNNIPTSVAKKLGADIVVTVDINSARGGGTDSKKYLDMVFSSISIMMKNSSIKGYLYADVLIKPDMRKFSAAKLTGKEEMVELGYKTTLEKIDEVKKLMGIKVKSPTMRERWANRKKKIIVENDGSLMLEFEELESDLHDEEQKEVENNNLTKNKKPNNKKQKASKVKGFEGKNAVAEQTEPLAQGNEIVTSGKPENKKKEKVVIVKQKENKKTLKGNKKQSHNKKSKTLIIASKKEVADQEGKGDEGKLGSKTNAKQTAKSAGVNKSKPKTKNKPVVIVKNKKTSKK